MQLFLSLFLLLLSFTNVSVAESNEEDSEKIFTALYDKNWGPSRPDDSLLKNAAPYIDLIQSFLKENNIRSVVEVGCGDWKVARYISWGDIQYHGYDIVKSVIEEDTKMYGTPNIKFTQADFLSTDLPPADLLICKDVLQHLTNEDVIAFLAKTKKFKHCLITNDSDDTKFSAVQNIQIKRGESRCLDLNKQPFRSPAIKLLTYSTDSMIKQVFYIKNGETNHSRPKETKTVLLAILAKNKAHTLPFYLKSIEELEYDKKLIVVYIRTNNNSDNTHAILSEWVRKHRSDYRDIVFEDQDLENTEDQSNPHNWTTKRWKLLAEIRNRSLEKAKEHHVDFYFVADCDNFILPYTLKYLVQKDKPIIAPMLRTMPKKNEYYCNYSCDFDLNGYHKRDYDYYPILRCNQIGTFKVPLVHCTYLIKSEYLDKLSYLDDTDAMEFVVLCRWARKNGIDQYICNERTFGSLYHNPNCNLSLEKEIEDFHLGLSQ